MKIPKINSRSRTFAQRKLTSSVSEDLLKVDHELSGPEIKNKVSRGSKSGDDKAMF